MIVKHLVATALFFAVSTPVMANTEEVYEDTMQTHNMWVCEAIPAGRYGLRPFLRPSSGPVYHGYSQVFAAGSGAGQQGRVEAFRSALQTCQRSARTRCHSRIEDCQVQRFNATWLRRD
jgi:hypothetical protein